MEEIKNRTAAVWAIIDKTHTTPFRATNIEFACLQIRKILELIALASLSAKKEEYAKQHANFFKHWKAKSILEAVGKVNPNFYPIPSEQVGDQNRKVRQVRIITEGFLTKDDFATVYDTCSQTLHASNPYNKPNDYAFLEKEIPRWMQKIKTLLNHHIVHLINKKQSLWVIMRGEDEKAHGTIFEKLDVPTPKSLEEAEKIREDYMTSIGKAKGS